MDPFASYSTVAGASRADPPAFAVPAPGDVGRAAPSGLYAGSLGYGAGGPAWLDAGHTKRPPTPPELVNAVKAVAYSCIKLNALGVAKVPLRLYAVKRPGQRAPRRSFRTAPDSVQRRIRFGPAGRGTAGPGLARSIGTNDEIDEVLDHPFLQALENPNPYFDRVSMLSYLSMSLDAVGDAFVFPSRPYGADGLADDRHAAAELWPLQAQYVYPTKGTRDELVSSWRYFGDTYQAQELVRTRWVSLRDPYLSGYAPLHACYEQSSVLDYYTASVESTLKNGARPDFLIGPKDPLFRWGEDERERFDKDVNKNFRGANRGRAWIVDGAFDVHNLTYSPADLGGLQLAKEQRLLCANCFGVPISLLQSEDSNRATAAESTHQHQYYAIEPRCCLIASSWTRQLAQPVDDRLFFYFDDPVSRDVEQESKVWAMRVGAGQATLNEWRASDNLPPVEGGDANRIPNSLVAINGAPDGDTGTGDAPGGVVGGTASPGDTVQDQALNGAQISSLVEIVQNVRDGVIPPASAVAILAAAFPGLSPADVNAIITPVEVRPAPDPAPGPAAFPGPAARSGDELTGRILSALDTLERSLNVPTATGPGPANPGTGDAGTWPDGAGPE